mmetsp:Transcript_42359/g.76013  ORF Transcript_42359/g.76013 Transcript_42359/m.76013 type:complete len:97 (+) Transcript_42359:407-697(+)
MMSLAYSGQLQQLKYMQLIDGVHLLRILTKEEILKTSDESSLHLKNLRMRVGERATIAACNSSGAKMATARVHQKPISPRSMLKPSEKLEFRITCC